MKKTNLAEKLTSEPQRFSFFQAVRLLERTRNLFSRRRSNPALVGEDYPPGEEAVRFQVPPSFTFPPGEIQAFEPPTDDGPPRMSVSFLGLIGPAGVLPRHYTQLTIDRVRQKDHSFREFLDIFHHRLISLFYRAWRKFRFYVGYERAAEAGTRGSDDFTQALYALVGLGTAGLRDRQQFSDEVWLYYAGQFAHAPRNAVSLAALAADFLSVPVKVEQFVGQWLYLDRSDQSLLPGWGRLRGANNELGRNVVVGERVWGVEQKVRIQLGPLTYREFLEYLPSRARLQVAAQFIRDYIGSEFDFELQLVLAREEVPGCQLGGDGEPSRLGWNSWLRTEPFVQDARDAVFAHEGWPR